MLLSQGRGAPKNSFRVGRNARVLTWRNLIGDEESLTETFFSGGGTMSRKYKGNMNGQQYVAQMNPYKRDVHDLDNENRNCLIDEIIRAGQDKPYTSLLDARRDDYNPCAFCLQGSTR